MSSKKKSKEKDRHPNLKTYLGHEMHKPIDLEIVRTSLFRKGPVLKEKKKKKDKEKFETS